MAIHNDAAVDHVLEKFKKRARSARMLSVLLTLIPLVAALLFLFLTVRQIQKARSEVVVAEEDLKRVAEETESLRLANEKATVQLAETKEAINRALRVLKSTSEIETLPEDIRTAISDSVSKISEANAELSTVRGNLNTATGKPLPDLVPTIILEICDSRQMEKAKEAKAKLEKQGFTVFDISRIPVGPTRTTQVRYFHKAESPEAQRIVEVLSGLNIKTVAAVYFSDYEHDPSYPLRQYEIRFSAVALKE